MSEKIIKTIASNAHKFIAQEFKTHVIDIVNKAAEIYEDELLSVTIPKNSLANPEFFYDAFIEKLMKFEYVNTTPEIQLIIPNDDTFDFGNTLIILKFILEGVTGTYLELPEKSLNKILATKGLGDSVKRKFRSLPGISSSEIPISRRFRLLSSSDTIVKVAQEIIPTKLILFPFSNSPPIELFDILKVYVDATIDQWINNGLKKAMNNMEMEK